jgi:predicted O-linked N-acetylglucosamine transferase (SPINDLY family)
MTSRAPSLDDASAKDGAPRDGAHGYTTAPVKDEALARLQLGEALLRTGQAGQALDAFDAGLALVPGDPVLHAGRGKALLALHRPDEALAAYDLALASHPAMAGAHLDRGVALRRLGRLEDAVLAYERAIAIEPRLVAAHFNRANALAALGKDGDALAGYRATAAVAPSFAEAHLQAGNMLFRLTRFAEALEAYDAGLALHPRDAVALANRGATLLSLDRAAEALESCDRALTIDSDSGDAHYQRGNALAALRRFEAAVTAYRRANHAGYRGIYLPLSLGDAYRALGRLDEARATYRDATGRAETAASAWFNLGNVARDRADYEAAAECYDRAFAIDPELGHLAGARLLNAMSIADWKPLEDLRATRGPKGLAGARGFSPFALLGLVDDPRAHLEASRTWARKWPPPGGTPSFVSPVPQSKIRVGYFCTDFRAHATAYLIAGMLESHDKDAFEITAFSIGVPQLDQMRARLMAACDTFLDCHADGDDAVVTLARTRQIDIAVDLNGYATTNRPGIFSRRAAPVQVSLLAYPGTMAMPTIDYLFADRIVVPPGAEDSYTEKIIRLPWSYQMNDRKRPEGQRVWRRQELGLPEGALVFCCFNNNFKILPETFARWMKILEAVPHGVLWLLEDNAPATRNLRAAARGHGVDPARIVFARRAPLDDHIARHRCADLFLDTLPYNAHTTASDALWAGLPVLTLAGRSFAGRVAASLLHAVGLPELVTHTPEQYEATAIGLARDPAALDAIRRKLAANRLTAPLFDTPRFTRDLEAAYRLVHTRRIQGLAPDHLDIARGTTAP